MTPGRVLITGAGGFTGRYLTEYLRRRGGREIVTTSRREFPGAQLCDLADRRQVLEFLAAEQIEQGQHITCTHLSPPMFFINDLVLTVLYTSKIVFYGFLKGILYGLF